MTKTANRRRGLALAAGAMCVALVASCGSPDDSGASTTDWVMGTAPPGGTYYELGSATAEVVADYVQDLNINVRVSAGSNAENAELLLAGEIELGWMSAPTFRELQDSGKNTDKLQVVFNAYPSVMHWLVRADSGIDSPADWRGKPVAVGNPETGMQVTNKELLDAGWGISFDDIEAKNLHVKPGLQALKDGNVQAIGIPTGVPLASLLETSRLVDLKLLSLSDDDIAKIRETYPEWAEYTISESAYPEIKMESRTVAKGSYLVTHDGVDQEMIYKYTKALYEHLDKLAKLHSTGKQFNKEYAVSALDYLDEVGVEFAPGAARYFEEIGVMPRGAE